MTIRTKLLLAIVSPLAVLAILASFTVFKSWNIVSEMEDVQHLTTFATKVSSLVHETQKERGATAGFLGSSDGSFNKRLEKQRKLTDGQLAEFSQFLETFDANAFGDEYNNQLNKAREQIDLIFQKRKLISSRSIPAGKAIGFYTNLNGLLLDTVGKSALVTSDGEIALRICAFNAFLKSKERAGIERAVLSNTFASDKFGPNMYEKFTALVALQKSFMAEFLNIATPSDREFYGKSTKAPSFEQVNAFRAIAVSNSATGNFGQDAGKWFDTITAKINVLKSVDDHLASGLIAAAGKAAQTAQTALTTVAAGTAIVVCLVAAIGWLAVRSTTSRLAAVTSRVRDIAGDNADLTSRLAVDSDEIGELSKWVNSLLERMESIVVGVMKTSTDLTASANQLVDTADSLKSGADDSKTKSSTISAAAEEMSINMNQTAAATEQMSTGIAGVSDSLESIRTSIEEVASRSKHSASIAQTATECVETGNGQINQLGDAAQEIGNVINVIQDIAEQTNLLALNATIEAARAGEAGKGFAVVATEVKELASQTATATDGIRDRVLAMQGCAEQTVSAMADIDQVIRNVREASDSIADAVALQTGSVAEISSNMHQSSEASRRISNGIGESALASQEITKSVAVVDNTLGETANGADLTHSAGRQVAKLAEELSDQVAAFQTSQIS